MRIALSFIALTLAAAPAFATEPMTCEGVFGPDSSAALLEETFGADNVVTGEVPGPEGESMIATTVFPGDPEREFMAVWWDDARLNKPSFFTVPKDGMSPGGLTLGMGIEEVEKLNRHRFTVTGFYWDYGGAAWFEKGELSGFPGGCFVNVSFTPTVDLPPGTDDSPIVGDTIVDSDLPLLRQVKPVLYEIRVGYPWDTFFSEDDEVPAGD